MPHRYDNRDEHRGVAFFMALAMHGLLAVFLLFSVNWQTRVPEPVNVELWGGPPPAAPRVVVPEPEPVVPKIEPKPEPVPEEKQPDIATEKARPTSKPKATEKPLPTEKPAPTLKPVTKAEKAEKPPKEEPCETLQCITQQGLKERTQGKPGKAGGTGSNTSATTNTGFTGAGGAGGLDDYKGRLVTLFKSKIHYPDDKPGNPQVELRISILPDGSIREVVVLKASVDPAYDQAALRAVRSVDRLPDPGHGRSFRDSDLREMRILFRLREN